MKRLLTALAFGMAAGSASADAGDAAAQSGLALEPGKPVEILCETKAVLVATDKANASNGSIRLKLERKGEADSAGTWSPMSRDGQHAASLAAMQEKTCASGCPLSLAGDGTVQLWAPAPKSLDKLGADELLLLAVVKSGAMELKASTFRGQQIEALESGTCRLAEAAAEATPPR